MGYVAGTPITVADLIAEIKEDYRQTYGEGSMWDIVVEDNRFEFVVFHDDHNLLCVCEDTAALLDQLADCVHLGDVLFRFWQLVPQACKINC